MLSNGTHDHVVLMQTLSPRPQRSRDDHRIDDGETVHKPHLPRIFLQPLANANLDSVAAPDDLSVHLKNKHNFLTFTDNCAAIR